MNNNVPCQFDGTFTGNILVLGQTGCGKTTLVQDLGKNKIFRYLESVQLISKKTLKKMREDDIRSCFNCNEVNFHYPDNISGFNVLTQSFQYQSTNIVYNNRCKIFEEKKIQ